MKKHILLAIALAAALGAGCSPAAPATPTQAPAATPTAQPATAPTAATSQNYALDDLAKHATADDCWMAISGKVYDVTNYVDQHPAGPSILKGCGKEATDMFNRVKKHDGKATEILPQFLKGDLKR